MGARRSRRAAGLDHGRRLTKTQVGAAQSSLPEGDEHHQPDVISRLTRDIKSKSRGTAIPRKPRVRRPNKKHLVRGGKHVDGDGDIVVVGEKAAGSVRPEQIAGYNPARNEVRSNEQSTAVLL